MFLLDRMLIGGIRFALDKVRVAAEEEWNDDSKLKEELLAAQMRVELGEMSQEDFAHFEDEVLARIREIREARGESMGAIQFGDGREGSEQGWGAADIAQIDAEVVADDLHQPWEEVDVPPAEAVVDAAPVRKAAAKRKARPAAGKKPPKKTGRKRR